MRACVIKIVHPILYGAPCITQNWVKVQKIGIAGSRGNRSPITVITFWGKSWNDL